MSQSDKTDRPSNSDIEHEIKLDLGNEENYAKLISSLGAPQVKLTQKNYFFDTSDSQLTNSLWALRLRISEKTLPNDSQIESKAEITLKGPQEGQEGPKGLEELSARSEINCEIPMAVATASIAGGSDLTALDISPIVESQKIIGKSKLIPLVSFENLRLVFTPSVNLGCQLEVDLSSFGDSSKRYELEMEFPELESGIRDKSISEAKNYIQEMFNKLEIPYCPQPISKLADALSKRSLLA